MAGVIDKKYIQTESEEGNFRNILQTQYFLNRLYSHPQ